MSFETEIKAHVSNDMVDSVKKRLLEVPSCVEHGQISKFDIYWSSTSDGDPFFRTRQEVDSGKPRVLFTAKPHKNKSLTGTENNEELEFEAPSHEWDNILSFLSGIGYEVCRIKWKKGWHCSIVHNGYDIHAELLNVRYLGWFLEMEICTKDSNPTAVKSEDCALREVLTIAGLKEDAIEATGYNKLLKAIGKEKG